ncbi:MAG: outer membrane protein assembly factor BamD [Candidatus Brocadiia bacterium]|nr:outer membrane protein assembly factor BamD [Candidatus Brocadiia bacterium]
MSVNWRSRRIGLLAAAVGVVMALAGGVWAETGVWMPETGEVDLDALPRGTPEERFKHAAALVGTGQGVSGVRLLEELVLEVPDAPFAEEAHYRMGWGLFVEKRYREAFDRWDAFRARYPESPLRAEASNLQLHAASLATGRSVEAGLALFGRLMAEARAREDDYFVMRCWKEKADAILATGDYLRAREEYLSFIDFLMRRYPDSAWTPYCWFKIAECDLAQARWLERGTERLEEAERAFSDFVTVFPEDKHVPEARERIKQVNEQRAAKLRETAEYYLGPANRPDAALNDLEYMKESFPGTKEAEWAEEMIRTIREAWPAPGPGGFRRVELRGVRRVELRGVGTQPAAELQGSHPPESEQ